MLHTKVPYVTLLFCISASALGISCVCTFLNECPCTEQRRRFAHRAKDRLVDDIIFRQLLECNDEEQLADSLDSGHAGVEAVCFNVTHYIKRGLEPLT